MMDRKWLFLFVLFLMTAVAFFLIRLIGHRSELPVYGAEGHSVPGFEFKDQLGNTLSSTSIKDKIWVVNFFFTSCPTICPMMTRNLQMIHDYYRTDGDIKILSFTIDPKRDSPERLKSYADLYKVNHENWRFLTGDKEEIYRLARQGFNLSAIEGSHENSDFIHSENIVLMDKDRRIRGIYKGTDKASMKKLLSDISKLK